MRISHFPNAHLAWVFVEGEQPGFEALSRYVVDHTPDDDDPYTRFMGRLAEKLARPNHLGEGRHQVILGLGQTAALIHTLRQDGDATIVLEGADATADQIVATMAKAMPEEFSTLDDFVDHVRRMVSEPADATEDS